MLTPIFLLVFSMHTFVLTPILGSSTPMEIPRRSLGNVYLQSNATRSSIITLTVYMDFTCFDAKTAYPTIIQLADMLEGRNFELVVLSFSLPYHRNSHIITQAIHFIKEKTEDNGAVFEFITDVFDHFSSLKVKATREKTDYDVLKMLVPLVTKVSGIPSDTFLQEVTDWTYNKAARTDFKYSCTRGVFESPTFMLNDVIVMATPTWTVDQWMEVIEPLLEPVKTSKVVSRSELRGHVSCPNWEPNSSASDSVNPLWWVFGIQLVLRLFHFFTKT